MARTAAITGAYGYLGSLIRSRLEGDGWRTIPLVRAPDSNDAHAVAWSLGQRPAHALLASADALVHCAYDFTPRARDQIWRVNVQGTSALLGAARTAGVERLLVLSTMSAYEGTRQLYGQAKLAIERETLAQGGIAIRPGLVYGDEPGGMVGTLLKLTRLPLVPVIGGAARQFPVYAEDLARVVLELLNAADWVPEVFGVAQSESMRFGEVLAALAEREGRQVRPVPVPWRIVYWPLRLAELLGLSLPLRSDSVFGLVRPAPTVPRSVAFPTMLEGLTPLKPPPREGDRDPTL